MICTQKIKVDGKTITCGFLMDEFPDRWECSNCGAEVKK